MAPAAIPRAGAAPITSILVSGSWGPTASRIKTASIPQSVWTGAGRFFINKTTPTVGGRLRPLRVGSLEVGEAMFIPGADGSTTLAEREKAAIVRTLDQNSWKLAETARELGISRTTLWRRLKAYGLHRDGRTKWTQAS